MKRFFAIALACCAVVFALAGCSGAAKSTDAESLKGFWEIDPASTTGFEAILNLDDENFAELVVADAYLEGEWKADGSTASITFDENQVANIYLSGDKLVLGDDNGSKLVFVKSDIDEYYESEGEDDTVALEEGDMAGLDDVDVVDEVIEDITPVSIVDDKVVKIEVNGKGTDFTADPGYRLAIENKTDKTIYVIADEDFTVDGKSIAPGLGEVIDPGESAEAFMYFPADDLGGSIEKLVKVQGSIVVGDDETSDELGTYTFKMD